MKWWSDFGWKLCSYSKHIKCGQTRQTFALLWSPMNHPCLESSCGAGSAARTGVVDKEEESWPTLQE